MIKQTACALAMGAATAISGTAAFAAAHGEITVAYFVEWPMPFQ